MITGIGAVLGIYMIILLGKVTINKDSAVKFGEEYSAVDIWL